VFYGVRYEVPDTDKALEPFETNSDPRCHKARQVHLKTYFGRLTDGEPYFFYVGAELARMGVEGDHLKSYNAEQLQQIIAETDEKLARAAFNGERKLWLQLEAQY